MRVLIVEDDKRLADLIARVLKLEHHAVDLAYDGETGLEYALTGAYRVGIVDWMLPKRDGPSICRHVRASQVPLAILMLTARSQVEDRVQGLDHGADDYLVKPFAFPELTARVRALIRRYSPPDRSAPRIQCGDIVLDMRAHTAQRNGRLLHLTETEWNLLECFISHAGQALTRRQIFEQVWGVNSDAQHSMVDVYVSYLRHKLSPTQETRNPIETVRGVGYRYTTG